MEAQQELKAFTQAANRAWRVMMNGSEIDARSVHGEEGVNYVAWCFFAAAERRRRQELDLA